MDAMPLNLEQQHLPGTSHQCSKDGCSCLNGFTVQLAMSPRLIAKKSWPLHSESEIAGEILQVSKLYCWCACQSHERINHLHAKCPSFANISVLVDSLSQTRENVHTVVPKHQKNET